MKKCAVTYSGGKDGHLALMRAVEDGFDVKCLINFDAGAKHRRCFNDTRKTEILKRQAEAMGFFLSVHPLSEPDIAPSDGLSGNLSWFAKILGSLEKIYGLDAVYSGVTSSDEGGNDREIAAFGEGVGITIVTPLSGMSVFNIIKSAKERNIQAIIVALEKNLDKRWLGRSLGDEFVRYMKNEIKKGNRVTGNDFQTLVVKSPLLKAELRVLRAHVSANKHTWFFNIDKYEICI